jgi:hypothetical protein
MVTNQVEQNSAASNQEAQNPIDADAIETSDQESQANFLSEQEAEQETTKLLNENRQERTVAWIVITLITIYGVILLACFCIFAIAVFKPQADRDLLKDIALVLLTPATILATFVMGFYLGSKQKG